MLTMAGKLKIKRDITSTNPPATGEIEVGELAFNAITGKLYTKLQSGIVIEFVGRPICFSRNPIIIFPDVTNFCCPGDILNVTVKDLYPDKYTNNQYLFFLDDITNAGKVAEIVQNPPMVSDYDVLPDISLADPAEAVIPVPMKQAIIPFNIKTEKAITTLKFRVQLDSEVVATSQITITCTKF
jgi:hypothetical protein